MERTPYPSPPGRGADGSYPGYPPPSPLPPHPDEVTADGGRRRRRILSTLLALGLVVSLIGLGTGIPRLWQENLAPESKVRPAASSHPPAGELAEGVVVIEAEAEFEVSTGTGMVLTEDGEIITAYHVVENASMARALDPSTGVEYELELAGYNHALDIALMRTVGSAPLATVTIDADGVTVGGGATVVGNANGQGYLSEFHGEIRSTGDWAWVGTSDGSPPLRVEDLIRTDADVVSGCSGGPLLDADGEVVGVVVIGSDRPDPDGYAVPISSALTVVDQIRAGAEVDGTTVRATAALGIVTVNARVNPREASDLATEAVDGLQIVRFVEGSAAEWAGLQIGDVVTSLDGRKILFPSELAAELREREPKELVRLGVVRAGGAAGEVQVRLGERTRF